ncbi:hypothetical protein [Mesorhizobium sp. M1142]|uniref:hypothetical protein n=1 Tax=Mesorhizobium sp. M1142 TaxID=2957060 RepID=UPI0033362917
MKGGYAFDAEQGDGSYLRLAALIGQNPRNIGLILRNGKEDGLIDSGLISKAGIVVQTRGVRPEDDNAA